ncbi:MAG: hypothetical protein AB7O93_21395 [Vicinamibacterales bacterium]
MPVDDGVVGGIDRAVIACRLVTVDGSPRWLEESAEAPDGVAGTFRHVEGACVFHVPALGGGHRCAVHACLGHEALPASCQHFPRVCLVDDRGVRVSLSHACPTAAALLVDYDEPVTLVPGPPAVPDVAVPEGLDARGTLPPRLSERVLCDLDGLSAWEAHVVDTLAGPAAVPGTPEDVLARLRADAEHLRAWRPAGDTLDAAVRALREADRPSPPAARGTEADGVRRRLFDTARATCRAPWTWPAAPPDLADADARWVEPAWADAADPIRRYLAARAFGAWQTYQADATRGLAGWLDLALAVVRVECARAAAEAGRRLDRAALVTAVGAADRLLLHYADGAALAGALAARA